MANTASAKKAIRSGAKKHVFNLRHRRAFRSVRKDIKELAAQGNTADVQKELSKFYKEVDKAAKSKAIHPNAAARYKSNLTKQLAHATETAKPIGGKASRKKAA